MEENLKIEEYKILLEKMDSLCNKMPDIIFQNYFDNNKYLYSLYHEAFNSIKGFCVLMGNGALISQSTAVLRMAIEQTATIRILEEHKELQEKYIEHQKLRFNIKDKSYLEQIEFVKTNFKNIMDDYDKNNALKYLEYGWFKSINGKYGFNTLIDLSKIQEQDDAIIQWKSQLNKFIHGVLEFANISFSADALIIYAHNLIEIAAKLLDIIIVEFHNENKFNFVIDNVNYREAFLDAYKSI